MTSSMDSSNREHSEADGSTFPTVVVTTPVGIVEDFDIGAFRVVGVPVPWGAATKHRQVAVADDGTRVRVKVPRGTRLDEGLVLATDTGAVAESGGPVAFVVRRPPEPAVTVRFADNPGEDSAGRFLQLGYLLGNRHAPIYVDDECIITPQMRSPRAERQMLDELGLIGEVAYAPLAPRGWSGTSGEHAGEHSHTHSHADGHSHELHSDGEHSDVRHAY